MKKTILIVIFFTCFLFVESQPAFAQDFYDDFNDNYVDPFRWVSSEYPETNVEEIDGKLELSITTLASGPLFGASLHSRCMLLGNFDIQVEYSLLSWSFANGVRLGIGAAAEGHSVSLQRASWSSNESADFPGYPREVYVMDHTLATQVAGITATEHQMGKLRLQRIGTTVTGYYYDDTLGWIEVASYPTTSIGDFPAVIGLSIWSHDYAFTPQGQNIKISFDNMIINQGQLYCPISVDFKPGSCPNPVNLVNKGGLPIAILGTAELDVTKIDPTSIVLKRELVDCSVSPLRWSYEDVATPFEGELCDCHDLNGDGYMDMTLKFDNTEVVDCLELIGVAGETIPLILTGNLKEEHGGTPIIGEDCMRFIFRCNSDPRCNHHTKRRNSWISGFYYKLY